jgi:hypothetical protein
MNFQKRNRNEVASRNTSCNAVSSYFLLYSLSLSVRVVLTVHGKEEIAETLGLPKKFVNEMCRWLVESGDWKLVRTTRGGVTRRELRLSFI